LAVGVTGHPQKVPITDPRDLQGILEGQENTGGGAIVGGQLQQVPTLEVHRPSGNLIIGVARQYLGEGTFARAIQAHDGVDLTGPHLQVEALENFYPIDAGMEIVNGQNQIAVGINH